jgi:hypothetical protein
MNLNWVGTIGILCVSTHSYTQLVPLVRLPGSYEIASPAPAPQVSIDDLEAVDAHLRGAFQELAVRAATAYDRTLRLILMLKFQPFDAKSAAAGTACILVWRIEGERQDDGVWTVSNF